MRQVAKEVASRRRIVRGQCLVCGRPFQGTVRRMYCSHACAQRAHYRRKKGQQDGQGA